MVIEYAKIKWDQGIPYSKKFNDIYFCKKQGYEESKYVFLEQNNLSNRFKNLKDYGNFTIGETGFGTGLNFLTTWKLWQETAPKSCYLHYISTEQFPLSYKDLSKSLKLWSDLKCYSTQLLSLYPKAIPGLHYLKFCQGRVRLTLLLGDACCSLKQLDNSNKVNAWFLDGFNPKKNEKLWNEEIFQIIASLSNLETTFSTFTAASWVKKNLVQAGFQVNRIKGFAHKRHILHGKMSFLSKNTINSKPWFIRRQVKIPSSKHAVIIGGGLSGAASASSLAESGWKVTLIERKENLAPAASANSHAILYLKLSEDKNNTLNDFRVRGYLYSLQYLKQYVDTNIWCKYPILQLADNNDIFKKQQAVVRANLYPDNLVKIITARQACFVSNINIEYPGLFFPDSGLVNIPCLCSKLIDNKNIKLKLNLDALKLQWCSKKKEWNILGKQDRLIAKSSVVIIANAADATKFKEVENLPIRYLGGQNTLIPASNKSKNLKTIICARQGCITPIYNNMHNLGATMSKKIKR